MLYRAIIKDVVLTTRHKESGAFMRQFQKSSAGSVHKRLGRGRWEISVKYRDAMPGSTEAGEPAWGKWKTMSKIVDVPCSAASDKGKQKARKLLVKWRQELENLEEERSRKEEKRLRSVGRLMPSLSDCVLDYVEVRLPRKRHIEASTKSGYRRRASYVAKSSIADKPIDELEIIDIESLRNELMEAHGPFTVRDVLVLVKASLKDAVLLGLIPSSPAEFVTSPKPPSDEPNYLPDRELAALTSNLKSESAKKRSASIDATRLALATGMREGEICALRWQDVDFDAGIVRVRRAIGRDGDRGEYVKTPKTRSSRRDIPISDGMVEMLASRRGFVESAARQMGTRFSPNWFVFGVFDRFMSPKVLARNFTRRAKRLNLHGSQDRTPTFHCLRHTFATVAIRSGADVKSVSSILGHTDASVTLNMYAAADPKAKRETARMVSPLLE